MFTTTKQCVDGRSVILVYGPSGIGKTQLIQTLPNPERCLIINADNGLKSLERFDVEIPVYDITKRTKRNPDKSKVMKDGKPVLEELPIALRFPKLIDFLTKKATDPEFQTGFDWLIFDDMTEILNMLFDYLENMPEFKGKDEMALKLWKNYDKKGTEFIKQLRDFVPYNILILGLSSVEKEVDTGKRFIGLNAPGQKLPQRIPALVDEVFYYDIVKDSNKAEHRKLITATHKTAVAKDRSGRLSKFENPDLAKIIIKMKGKDA